MAVSTATDNRQTLRDFVTNAASLAGHKRRGEALQGQELIDGRQALQDMLNEWEMVGLHLHKSERVTLFMEPDINVYKIGLDARAAINPIKTSTPLATATGTTVVPRTTTGMTVGDVFGVYAYTTADQNATEIVWSTITAIASLTVTLADSLPFGAPAGAVVYSYTATVPRPIRLEKAWMLYNHGNSRNMIKLQAENDFFNLQSNTTGDATSVYYDPRRDTYGELHVYPIPYRTTEQLLLKMQLPAYLPQDNSDFLDIPQQWTSAVKYNLAVRLSHIYGTTKAMNNGVIETARDLYELLDAHDRESTAYVDTAPEINYLNRSGAPHYT